MPFHLKLSSILEQLPKVFILTLRILSLIVTYQYKFEVHLVWSLSLYYSLIQQCFLLTPVMLSVKFLLLGHLNPKKAGEGVNLTPLSTCKFSKNVSSKQRLKPCVFMTFNIIISYIFPENFIELPQVVQNIWRLSLSILAIFMDFQTNDVSLWQMMSRFFHFQYTLNRLFNNCIKSYWC